MLNLSGFFNPEMPVKSYLIFPKANKTGNLVESLSRMNYCEVFPSEDEKIIILVTETESEQADEKIWNELQGNTDIQQISLIAAFNQ